MSSTIWSVDEHLDDILATVRPLEPIELQLPDAQGCVLVKDVVVEVALPPFDNSSMDGYAVRIADVEGRARSSPPSSRSSVTSPRAAPGSPTARSWGRDRPPAS
ncbi:hypothetical protein Smic_31780 [Streptomyces microflavus]|uniref:Molybdopterin molybdenumtransferase n=1 Tax=Streptomyces microflavus TaxID=1919 RepID=A0A7J0CQ58_STRMI|nr:hypothetical protein Smic_31780 [Streptomyces microflavus]